MIRSFEELGDCLAETENRLSYLENSQPVWHEPAKEIVHTEPADLTQLRTLMIDVRKLVKQHLQWHNERSPKESYTIKE